MRSMRGNSGKWWMTGVSALKKEGGGSYQIIDPTPTLSLAQPTNMGNKNSSRAISHRPLPKIKFRVLIIGRANSGKTSILQRVCDTTDSPVIYRRMAHRREQVRSPTSP
jgi:hypothetical protein